MEGYVGLLLHLSGFSDNLKEVRHRVMQSPVRDANDGSLVRRVLQLLLSLEH